MTVPTTTLHALPAQVLRTCKRLVQYIYEHDLEAGDRLPPQAELRRLLGKNNYTLGSAMQALASQGVVARKTCVGTVIRDLDAIGAIPWSVGVATVEAPLDGELSVFANLTLRVQTTLNRLGCRCLAYSCPAGKEVDRLRLFGLLRHDVEDQQLDGLVMLTMLAQDEWAMLREARIPIVHLPFWEGAPGGVVLDELSLVHEAMGLLAGLGCRRFGVISVHQPDSRPRFLAGLEQGLADAGRSDADGEWLDGRFGMAAGERVARQLLARPKAQRPDGLIVLDDYVALGLTNVLAQEAGYRPSIVAAVNRQLPLRFALPVYRYLIDLDDMAHRAVKLLQRRLLRPGQADELELAKGELITSTACLTATLTS